MHRIGKRFGSSEGVVFALAVLVVLAGCGVPDREGLSPRAVFFPPPPEQARLQFLKAFSGPEDLGARGPSGFEKFVLGEAERREGIATPYGVALHDGRIYVCDVARRRIEVLDLTGRSFGYMTEDRRLMNPVNIHIEQDGTKYVADPTVGAVFVFDAANSLDAILGRDLKINPIDVTVRGPYCYATDYASNQVVVLEKATGRLVGRIGEAGEEETQFKMISDLTFGLEGDLYVTDRLKGKIFQFEPSGELKRTIGRLGDNIDEMVRPKGIAVDRSGRIWVVDASTEVAKIYDPQGRLLLFFGRPGNEPGRINLPASIVLDYDHVDLFQQYAVEGAEIQFLVIVSNQYGPNKINVYGFGEFPPRRRPVAAASQTVASETAAPKALPEVAQPTIPEAAPVETPPVERPAVPQVPRPGTEQAVQPPVQSEADLRAEAVRHQQRTKEMADLYRRSLTLYKAGRLAEAREGFLKAVESGLLPPSVETSVRDYLRDIEARLSGGGSNSS